ncbi:MAG: TetR/AcrR family transcriptional regulator [Proteobacteria bacterium]|nr:TetR/AcrR family transcriptional regulator [Pseudomonadota bacterium]
MPRPAATPEQRERQRRRIRQAASEIYAENGPLGVSARAIAQRAGVSTGTLYSYFANLPDLMRSLWMEPVTEAGRELEAVAKAHRSPVKRIQALLTGYVEFARANPDVFRGALLFVRPPSLPKPEALPLHDLPFHRLLCTAIREGQLRGKIRRGNAEEMAQLLWAGLHGALALPINMDAYEIVPQEKLTAAMIRALMRSIEA